MGAETKIHLSFTTQQLDYIANALGARPWIEVQALLTDIAQQVQQHNSERSAPVVKANGAAHDLPTITQ